MRPNGITPLALVMRRFCGCGVQCSVGGGAGVAGRVGTEGAVVAGREAAGAPGLGCSALVDRAEAGVARGAKHESGLCGAGAGCRARNGP